MSNDGPMIDSLDILAQGHHLDLLQHDDEGAVLQDSTLKVGVHGGAFLGVLLRHGSAGLGCQRPGSQALRHVSGLALALSELSSFAAKVSAFVFGSW